MRAALRKVGQVRTFLSSYYVSWLRMHVYDDKMLTIPIRVYTTQVAAILVAIATFSSLSISYYVGENGNKIIDTLHDYAIFIEQRVPLQANDDQKKFAQESANYMRATEQ